MGTLPRPRRRTRLPIRQDLKVIRKNIVTLCKDVYPEAADDAENFIENFGKNLKLGHPQAG